MENHTHTKRNAVNPGKDAKEAGADKASKGDLW